MNKYTDRHITLHAKKYPALASNHVLLCMSFFMFYYVSHIFLYKCLKKNDGNKICDSRNYVA